MEPVTEGEFTVLLAKYRDGDDNVRNSLIELLYSDLHRIARRHMRGNRWIGTLDTTVLVNESYLRLVSPAARHVTNRAHFLNLAATVMRQIVCDYARKRLRDRHNLDREVDPAEVQDQVQSESKEARDIVWLNDALTDLAKVNERGAKVIECRFFGGLSEEETAQAIGVSLRTVERTWAEAKAWLANHMQEPPKS